VKCFYCFEPLSAKNKHQGQLNYRTQDHLWPQKYGGRVIVNCCLRCNNLKSDLDPVLFFCAILKQEQPWPKWPFKEPARKAFLGEFYSFPGSGRVFSKPFIAIWSPSDPPSEWYYKQLMIRAKEHTKNNL